MLTKTRQRLLRLNQDFYQQIATSFSDSRNYAWAGWGRVGEILVQNFAPHPNSYPASPCQILDLGCGNARFAEFLTQTLPPSISFTYHGLDNSSSLLQLAQEKIAHHPATSFILEKTELTNLTQLKEQLVKKGPFHACCLFGVLHHLPAENSRRQLLELLTSHLQHRGLLIISLWQFMNSPRLARRIVNPQIIQLTPADLDPNDYLLDWRRASTNTTSTTALRYCHHFPNSEITQLIHHLTSVSSLTLIDRYQADGSPNQPLNTYLIFQQSFPTSTARLSPSSP